MTKTMTEEQLKARHDEVSAELDQARIERDEAALDAATTGDKAAKDRLQKAQVRMNTARVELEALAGAINAARRLAEEEAERARLKEQESEFEELEDNLRELLELTPMIAEVRVQLEEAMDRNSAFVQWLENRSNWMRSLLGLPRRGPDPLPSWKFNSLTRAISDPETRAQGMADLVEVINEALTRLAEARGVEPKLVTTPQAKEAA